MSQEKMSLEYMSFRNKRRTISFYISRDTKSYIQKFGQEAYSTFKWISAEFLGVIIEIVLAFSV